MDNFEERACIKFIEKYINNYEECTVAFHIHSLSDAITKVCFKEPASLRRTLILYFHEDDDPFSKQFCLLLKDDDVKEIINESFYILAWDIGYEYDLLNHRLQDSLRHHFDVDIMCDFISERKSGIFLIRTISNVINVNSCISGSLTKSAFLSKLREVEKTMKVDYKIEEELTELSQKHSKDQIGSEKFQQIMFDQLGDRDYDRFELAEHEYLKGKIGFALFGPPQEIEESENKENISILDGYSKKQRKEINVLYRKICLINDEFSKWDGVIVISFIYNCIEPLAKIKLSRAKKYPDYNPLTDIKPLPIFVIRKCKGSANACRVFIDTDCRVYKSWNEYLTKNKLPKCKMVVPLNGKYQGESAVRLEEHFSPACNLSVAILKGADIASTVVALSTGGLFVAAMIPALTVAPIALTVAGVAGMGVGVYSIARSSVALYDRTSHRESMSFANSDARGAYINILAGSLGFVGGGATNIVSSLTSKGVNIGQGAQILVDTISGAKIAAGGIGMANSTYDVIHQIYVERQNPSSLSILQMSSSILFFGNAVYNFKTAGAIIEETQTRVLNEFQDSLRSNRDRKIFNVLLNESVLINGDTQGKAEVIASIHNMNQSDDVTAVLARSNNIFNKDGVRFESNDGKIQFNGVDVDISEYGIMNQRSQSQFHMALLPLPYNLPQTDDGQIYSKIINIFDVCSLEDIVVSGCRLVSNQTNFKSEVMCLLSPFALPIQEKIITISKKLIEKLTDFEFDFVNVMTDVFPKDSPLMKIFKFIVSTFKDKVHKCEDEYQREKQEAQRRPGFDENEFNALYGVNLEAAERTMQFFETSVDSFTSSTDLIIQELTSRFINWLAEQMFVHAEKSMKKDEREKNQKVHKEKTACVACDGYYFKKQ